LPLRAAFIATHSTKWKAKRDILSWNDIEPIYRYLKDILGRAAEPDSDPQTLVTLGNLHSQLFDISARIIPPKDIRRRQWEQAWLDALFVSLAYICCQSLPRMHYQDGTMMPRDSNSQGNDVKALQPLFNNASTNHVKLTLETLAYLTSAVMHSPVSDLPRGLLEEIINMDVNVFLPRNGVLGSEARLDKLKEWLLAASPVSEEVYGQVRDRILLSLLRGFAQSRDLPGLLELWQEGLEKAINAHYSHTGREQFLLRVMVWDADEITKEVQHLFKLHGIPSLGPWYLDRTVDSSRKPDGLRTNLTVSMSAKLSVLDTLLQARPEDFSSSSQMENLLGMLLHIASAPEEPFSQRWRLWRLVHTLAQSQIPDIGVLVQFLLVGPSMSFERTPHARGPLSIEPQGHTHWLHYMELLQFFSLTLELASQRQEVAEKTLRKDIDQLANMLDKLEPRSSTVPWDGRSWCLNDEQRLLYACLGSLAPQSRILGKEKVARDLVVHLAQAIARLDPDAQEESVWFELLEAFLSEKDSAEDAELVQQCLHGLRGKSQGADSMTAVQSRLLRNLSLQSMKKNYVRAIGKDTIEQLQSTIPAQIQADKASPPPQSKQMQSMTAVKTRLNEFMAADFVLTATSTNHVVKELAATIDEFVSGTGAKHQTDLLKLLRQEPQSSFSGVKCSLVVSAIVKGSPGYELGNEPQLVSELAFIASGKGVVGSQSPIELLICLENTKTVLELHPGIVNQDIIDSVFSSIANAASSTSTTSATLPIETKQAIPAAAIYSQLCGLLGLMLARFRRRLSDRHHLLLAALQSLLHCLFFTSANSNRTTQTPLQATSSASFTASLPSWLLASPSPLPSTSAQGFSRLLSSICNPTTSAARSRNTNSLNDETKKAKRIAGQHMQYLVMEYARCTLDGQLRPEVKECLVPGMYTVLDAMSRDLMRSMNAEMDPSSRAIFKGLYDDWTRFGRWDQS